jgi:hypothetical protein
LYSLFSIMMHGTIGLITTFRSVFYEPGGKYVYFFVYFVGEYIGLFTV